MTAVLLLALITVGIPLSAAALLAVGRSFGGALHTLDTAPVAYRLATDTEWLAPVPQQLYDQVEIEDMYEWFALEVDGER